LSVALFGFGKNGLGAYLYLYVDGKRIEGAVTSAIGTVHSIASYSEGFIIFSCDIRDEEYANFWEVAEQQGCLDEWEDVLKSVTDVKIVNE